MEKIATKDDLFNVLLTYRDITALKFALEPLLRRIVRKVKRRTVSLLNINRKKLEL